MHRQDDKHEPAIATEKSRPATDKQDEEEQKEATTPIPFSPAALASSSPVSHRRATAEEIAALSPSPFASASDDLPWEVVTGTDGGVLQYVLQPGDGAAIQPLHRIYMLARASTSPPAPITYLDRLSDDEVDFILGQAQQPKGVEIALCSLNVGCHVLLRIRGNEYGYSNTRRPDAITPDDTLHCELRVTRQEKEKNLHQMTPDDKLAYCRQRREIGKQLFTHNQPKSAYKQYDKARTVLQSLDGRQGEGGEERRELNVLMAVNAAACMQRVGDHIAVIELCNAALATQPTHAKALYRRATARMAREEWTDAAADLNTILTATTSSTDATIDGTARDRIVKQLARCKQQTRRADEGTRKRWDGFLLSEQRPALYDDRIQQREAEVAQERRESHTLLRVLDAAKQWLSGSLTLVNWAWQEGWRKCRRHRD